MSWALFIFELIRYIDDLAYLIIDNQTDKIVIV